MQLGSLAAGPQEQLGSEAAGLELSGDQAGLLQKALGGHPGGAALTPSLYRPIIQVCCLAPWCSPVGHHPQPSPSLLLRFIALHSVVLLPAPTTFSPPPFPPPPTAQPFRYAALLSGVLCPALTHLTSHLNLASP